MTFKQAEPVSRLEAKAGHTYVPNATISGDLITVYFEDKGLYVAVEESPNPGHAVYRTDKKCER